MKVLIFNGSPKGDQSDTMHLTRAFAAGLSEAVDADIQTINVIDKHIEYCRGCLSCKRNGGSCVFDDDMQGILAQILEADLLIFSFPLYNYGMPAHLKALLDRTMPLSTLAMEKVGDRYVHPGRADFSRLSYVMICGCGFPNSKNNFEAMARQFSLMFPERHTIITVPESPMFNAPEAALVTLPFLEIVKQAGYEYAQTGGLSQATLDRLKQPMIPEDVYAEICSREA